MFDFIVQLDENLANNLGIPRKCVQTYLSGKGGVYIEIKIILTLYNLSAVLGQGDYASKEGIYYINLTYSEYRVLNDLPKALTTLLAKKLDTYKEVADLVRNIKLQEELTSEQD